MVTLTCLRCWKGKKGGMIEVGFYKKKWTGAGRSGRLSKQEKKGRRKREEGVEEGGVGGILNCTVRIYPTNVFCCTPKFHRNFDPHVIKTKRTKVSISVLRDLPLVCVCVCVRIHICLEHRPPSVLGVHVQYKQDTLGSADLCWHTHTVQDSRALTHTHTGGCMD